MMAQHPASGRRVAALALSALALGGAALAVDAATSHAATVSPQRTLRAGTPIPFNFPGPLDRGDRVPRGFVLLARDIRMAPRERPTTITWTCPRGKTIRNAGSPESSEIGMSLVSRDAYTSGRRRVRTRIFVGYVRGPEATGSWYILCGKPVRR